MPSVLLKSDPRARQRPCLRCGYSLRHLSDSRNCPECGLAIRISLSDNHTLEWSNPAWLRRLSWALWLVMAAHGAVILGHLDDYLGDYEDGFSIIDVRYAWVVSLAFSLLRIGRYLAYSGGMLLLARPERRYPEKSKAMRVTLIAAAALVAGYGLLMAGIEIALRTGHWRMVAMFYNRPSLSWLIYYNVIESLAALAVWAYLHALWKRTYTRWPRRVCQYLMWWTGLALVLEWAPVSYRVRYVVWSWADPVICIVVLVWFAILLRRLAAEAARNWTTDP